MSLMRSRRAIAFVVLVTVVGSFGLPWIADQHQFNDDPHWAVDISRDDAADARIGVSREADDEHCLVCHLQRTLRTASRPSQTRVTCLLQSLVAPVSTVPATRLAVTRPPGARGPPLSFL
jgi:hypothetical protein